ncbi:hypothetical protein ABIF74_011839 [Bradyrhizobium japonicum]
MLKMDRHAGFCGQERGGETAADLARHRLVAGKIDGRRRALRRRGGVWSTTFGVLDGDSGCRSRFIGGRQIIDLERIEL